ncbi:MAG: DUF4139 domain-containing protein [Planctomycetota bacterium]|jgi:uncharacterized protein (TIGR02231 family)
MSTQQIARASRFASVVPIAAFTLVVWCFGPRASALDTNETIPADSRVVSASIHAGASAATVTRAAIVEIGEGLSVVRFTGLSPSIDRRTLQAGAAPAAGEAGEIEVVEVEVRSVPLADPEAEGRAAEIESRLEAIAIELAAREDAVGVISSQIAFLDAIAARRGDDARDRLGGTEFDPGAIERQLEFFATRHAALLAEARVVQREQDALERERSALEREQEALGPIVRERLVADVVVASSDAMSADLTIVYRTAGAVWRPAYRIRADIDGATSRIEYEAVTSQWTGEAWDEMTLELSTVDPSVPTAPPPIEPAFIDVRRPPPPPMPAADAKFAGVQAGRGFGGGGGGDTRDRGRANAAEAIDSGLAVAYRLPRPVSVPSDRSQSQRFRIDTIENDPRFLFVSRPRTGAPPSLRATLENATDLVLLPGRAGIFVDGEFVGETDMPAVQGRGEFELFLGVEPRIEVVRQPVVRNSSTTGLFGGGRLVTLANRIDLENRLPRPVIVELWDRRPVSRDEAIQITLEQLSRPLDQDAEYVETDLTRGLLRWTIALGAAGTPEARASVSWTVKIAHSDDIETTPIPE